MLGFFGLWVVLFCIDLLTARSGAGIWGGGRGGFFFKQKTAYEIMSGDWSSDVCSSD
eukprot:COSAG02_NODE_62451_length_266_cov_0.532934_2_plen_56_part_01